MEIKTIKQVAEEVGLVGLNKERFILFFSKRFPDESNNILSYVTEWANRFKTNEPQKYMDNKSLEVYDFVKSSLNDEVL